jgi:hypothetical protein
MCADSKTAASKIMPTTRVQAGDENESMVRTHRGREPSGRAKNKIATQVSVPSDEHGRQPSVVTLTKLNETNIKIAMKVADRITVYGFATANCAQQVGWCLRQGLGVAGGVVDLAFARAAPQLRDAAILTPWNLYAYAQSLRPVYG